MTEPIDHGRFDEEQDRPAPRGCLAALAARTLRLGVAGIGLLFLACSFGFLPRELDALVRPILATVLGWFGLPLAEPFCLDPGVRELLPFCAFAPSPL